MPLLWLVAGSTNGNSSRHLSSCRVEVMKGRQSLTENAVSQNQFLTFICHTLLTHLPSQWAWFSVCCIRCLLPPPRYPLTPCVCGLVRGLTLTLCVFLLLSLSSLHLFNLPRQSYTFLSTSVVSSKGIDLRLGVGLGGEQAKRRDEIESDRAEEAEEGGAEIKLNTNWQRNEETLSDKKRQPEGLNIETKTDRVGHRKWAAEKFNYRPMQCSQWMKRSFTASFLWSTSSTPRSHSKNACCHVEH